MTRSSGDVQQEIYDGLSRTVDWKPSAMKNKWTERLCIALLIFVLALGIFVRVYRLGSWPPLYADEAAPGVRALRGLSGELEQTSGNRVYFSSAYVLMQMPFVRLLGNSLTALRLSSLVCGLLTILAAYMTARQLWDAKHALLAAAVAAILPLSVVIGGRLAWEPSMSFPVIAMALYFGVVAWQRHSVLAATACGLFLALGTYAHPAATLALPGMIPGAILSGSLRRYFRETAAALIAFALLSFPSMLILQDLVSTGNVNVRSFARVGTGIGSERPISRFSLEAIGENAFRTLDHCTGVFTAQLLVGDLHKPWSLPMKLLRVAYVGLWLTILVAAARHGGVGRFMVGYLIGVFVVGHLMHPGFVTLPHKGRYLVAAAPIIPLLVTLVAGTDGDRPARLARITVLAMLSMWIGVTGVMLVFIQRDETCNQMTMTTALGDPNKAAADFLLTRVNPERDLVLSSWLGYWPIRYYSRDRIPVFTAEPRSDAELVEKPWEHVGQTVWWLGVGDAEPPPFAADLVSVWPERGGAKRCYAIWIVRDTQAAIEWATEDYLARLAERQMRLRGID